MGNNLVVTYSMLNSFINDEEAVELMKVIKLVKEKKLNDEDPKDKEKMDRFFNYATKLHDGDLLDEINEYIGEVLAKK